MQDSDSTLIEDQVFVDGGAGQRPEICASMIKYRIPKSVAAKCAEKIRANIVSNELVAVLFEDLLSSLPSLRN